MWVKIREFIQSNVDKVIKKVKNKNMSTSNFIIELFSRTKKDSNKIACNEMKTLSKTKNKQDFFLIIVFPFIIIYLELAFHLMIYRSVNNTIFIPILFALPSGMLIAWILNLFGGKVKKVLALIFTFFLCLIYCVQLVYYYVFKAFFSIFSIAGVGTDVLEFYNQIIAAIGKNLIGLIILLVPLFIIWYLFKKDIFIKEETILVTTKKVILNSEAFSKEALNKENSNRGVSGKEASNKETSNKKTSNKETSNKEASNKEASNKEAPNKETSNKEASNKETSNKEASNKEALRKKAITIEFDKYNHSWNQEALSTHNRRGNIHKKIIIGGLIILLHLLCVLMLPLYGRETYSPFDLYHNTWIQEMSMDQLGVLTSTRFDITRLIGNKDSQALEAGINLDSASKEVKNHENEQKNSDTSNSSKESKTEDDSTIDPSSSTYTTPAATSTVIDTSPNVLNIDFATLAIQETNQKIKSMHEYFQNVIPTNKNKYTGMFEGYNLILITAEGFSPYAVNPQVTPTLYKLTNEGFVFKNFYTPLWWASTSDGEYVACTSLIPKAGVTSFYLSGSNAMPFALGNQFRDLGYITKAYHDHTYTYYKRHISHPNMGYDYKGVGNGLVVKETWPESDLEMMEVTIPEYINNQPFHIYYMTVSGHMNYTFMGNSMAAKNKAAVDNLPYSMEAKAYLACNVELDKALEKLIKELENKGIADKTVIALSADHYPYGLEKNKIDELAGHEVESNFELYRNHFILWTKSMEEPIIIEKPCSSLDIAPTLSNLFGLPYDSRLFMGNDILSDTDPLVIFSNRSFITDKVKYNSKTKEVTKLTKDALPENYISTVNKIINNKFIVSEEILEEDYYSYILPFLSNK